MAMSVEDFRLELMTALASARAAVLSEAKTIVADQASRGALKTGATIKLLARAGVSAEKAAVVEALKDLDRAKELVGRSRSEKMRLEIEPQFEQFHAWLFEGLGLGRLLQGQAEVDAAYQLLSEGIVARNALLRRYDRGFSRADQKSWQLRHPIAWDVLKLLIGPLIGTALGIAGTLALQQLNAHGKQPASQPAASNSAKH